MKCERCHDLMTDALYHELTEEQEKEFRDHLAACAECARTCAGMEEAVRTMDKRERVEPEPAEWSLYWQRLEKKLDRPPALSHRFGNTVFEFIKERLSSSPRLAYGLAAVFCIVIGIAIGRMLYGPASGPGSQIMTASAAQIDSVNTAALGYLERSRNLLIGVTNLDDEDIPQMNFTKQQELSRDLVREGQFLKASLTSPDQRRIRRLIEDLEFVLMQLANVEVRPGVPAIEIVRKGMYHRSILFKINIEELRAMAPPAASDAGGSSSAREKKQS